MLQMNNMTVLHKLDEYDLPTFVKMTYGVPPKQITWWNPIQILI